MPAKQLEPITSLGQYVETLRQLKGELHGARHTAYWWFRGEHVDGRDPLPRVLRPPFAKTTIGETRCSDETWIPRAAEFNLNNLFLQQSAFLRSTPADCELVETYFLAQHHGLPTRLLDWSTNALAALFFAVEGKAGRKDQRDAVVYILPHNQLVVIARDGAIFRPPIGVRHPIVTHNIARLYEGPEAFDHCDPTIVPIVPDSRAGRMLQQGSVFTLHLPGCGKLPEPYPIKIRGDCAKAIEEELRTAGVTRSRLFPDLDNIAADICAEWGLAGSD